MKTLKIKTLKLSKKADLKIKIKLYKMILNKFFKNISHIQLLKFSLPVLILFVGVFWFYEYNNKPVPYSNYNINRPLKNIVNEAILLKYSTLLEKNNQK